MAIDPSPTADTRTCDVSKVSRSDLYQSSEQHIRDVGKALAFFRTHLEISAADHDQDKLTDGSRP